MIRKEQIMTHSSDTLASHKRALLLGNRVRRFIKDGGRLRYEARQNPITGKRVWVVLGVHPDEFEQPVFNSTSGVPKHFRSADALIRYHRQMCPDDDELTVPIAH